jgi:glycosyltransferase involved in cell wall biosynthesis
MTSSCLHTNDTIAKKVRIAYLVSHPIQYQTPLLRRIAREPDIELTVFFGSDFSVRGYRDAGFGVGVTWDVALLDGYKSEILPAIRDAGRTGPVSQISYGLLSRLRGHGGQAGFDLLWVHGYSTVNALHGMLVAKALGIPILVRAESRLMRSEPTRLKRFVKQLFFRGLSHLVDGVLPIGTANEAYWQHYFGNDVPQFSMPYAVDNDYFQRLSHDANAGRSALLEELNLDELRPIILFASKLQSRKRCGDLLEAYLKLLRELGDGPPPYLVIVGDGEERLALEKRARASGCEGIRFCGFRNQSELPGFFDIATVFVLPSRDEQWGLVVNEVMNAGRAVIVSDDVGCQPDLVTDGVEGCVFPVGDVDALTAALRRVLSDTKNAIGMGQRGLGRIRAWNFDEDVRGLRRGVAALTRRIVA